MSRSDNETRKNNITDEEQREAKKKLRGYALVRVVMMWIFALLFAVFVTISIMYMIRNHKANESSNKVMGDFNQITNAGTLPNNDTPIVIPPVQTEETTCGETVGEETTGGAVSENTTGEATTASPPATEAPEDEAYMKYVEECIAEAKKLKNQYPDFRAIIVIEGDTINLKYPILQSGDNDYYVNYLIDGTKNSTGEIFLDCRNNGDILQNRNSVIYGHNMNDGTKFGQLHKYKHNGAFYTHNVTVVTTEAVLTFKPFSFYKTDIYNPYTTVSFRNDAEFAEFCLSEQGRSMFESKLEFTGGERIITLSTCYGTSLTERYCLHAVLVNVAKPR